MKLKSNRSVFRILSLALLFCLLFTACTPASDPEGLFGTPSSEPEAIREGSWDYDLSEVPYHYGNASTMLEGSAFCDYGEKVLFAVGGDPIMLYEYDKRTGKIDTFCKNAVCDHEEPSCPAFVICTLELYNGKVYGNRLLISEHQLVELKNGRFETVLSPIFYAQHQQGQLYAMTNDGTLLKYPEGDFKNPEILKEDLSVSLHVFVDNYYYFDSRSGIHRFALNDPDTVETVVESIVGAFRTDGEYLYYCNKDYHLIRCNLDGSDPTPVTQMAVWPPSVNYDEAYIYFNACDPTDKTQPINNQIFRVKRDLTTEPELVADVGFRSTYIYTVYQLDSLFLFGSDGYYIIDKDGTDLQKLILPE